MLSSVSPEQLRQALAAAWHEATQPVATPEELNGRLTAIKDVISALELNGADPAILRNSVPTALASIDEIYFALRQRIGEWQNNALMTAKNQHALREAFRYIRFAKDMLGEVWVDFERIENATQLKRAFTGEHLNTNVHPDFHNAEVIAFQSGDVVLMRGMHHNSAAIAMIGDTDSQFSHVAMVYIDPNGKHWVVESMIDTGARIVPLEDALESGAGRTMLFRHRDAALSAAAAKFIYDRVKLTVDGNAPRILYDFTMRLDGGRQLFCSKLIRQAFKAASQGAVDLPTYRTVLGMKNRDFLKRIGVKARHTFAPGDIEIEPEFDLIAEWRDYRVTARLRQQDIVMAKFFEWMDTRSYTFKETFVIRLISLFGRLSGLMSETAKSMVQDVIPRVPRNMKRKAIAGIAMLHKTADPIVKDISAMEEAHVHQLGLPLHPKMIRKHLEDVRVKSNGQIGYLHRQG